MRWRDVLDWRPVAWLLQAIHTYGSNAGSLAAGGIAFYTFFALAPAAVAVGAVAGLFVDPASLSRAWSDLAQRSPDSLSALEPAFNALVQLVETSSGGTATVTLIASLSIAIYAASKAVYGLRIVLTQVHGGGDAAIGFVLRLISALAALVVIAGASVVLVAITIVPPIVENLRVGALERSWLNWLVLVALTWLVVWGILGLAPHPRVRIGVAAPGVVVASGWIVGMSVLFGLYSRWSTTVSTALTVFGAPLALLIWLYLSVIGIIFGAAVQATMARSAQQIGPHSDE